MKDHKCYEVQSRDIFLRVHTMTSCEILAAVRQPMVLFFAGLLVLTLVIFDTASLQTYMAWWQATLIWVTAVTVHIILYVAIALAWAWLRLRAPLPRMFLPLCGMSAYLSTYLLTGMLVQWRTGHDWTEILTFKVMLTGYTFALIGEAIYFAFVLPQLLLKLRGPVTPARSIGVAGQRFDLDEILTLRGQEHYVLVQTPDQTHKLRGRLSDLVSQTQEADGVLAHRSYWVSSQAISRLEYADGWDALVTVDGERLRVAQPRRGAVRSWVAQYAPHAAVDSLVSA